MRILLQFPEGLKRHASEYAERLEKQGNEVFLVARSTYGACDLALEEAKAIGAEKIVHFGHNRYIKTSPGIEVEYVPWKIEVDISLLKGFAKMLKEKGVRKIGIATTVQHIHQLNDMKRLFDKNGIKALTKKGKMALEEGQVLGCDASALDVDAETLVIVADGNFHALSAFDIDKKDIYSLNPYNGKWKLLNEELMRFRKQRKGALIAAYGAKSFGILVSTKPGQFRMKIAENAKKELEKRGKRAYVLVSNIIDSSIDNFMFIDAYVNTACPRMVDDKDSYAKPMIDISELKNLLKMWDRKD
ncbi:MAG: diphthamide biosynthesis enzyme Dph2 [Candidatus Micrarchaeota archaeon]|nr:diphthamide biosynthesis enzyme Dph2 [Candidatus Micrarchaeota archaeon]